MSIDKKAFGLSDSLIGAVNEALKGGQVKLDKNHNGKLDSQDFKILRGKTKNEQTAKDYDKANYKHGMMKEDQVDEGNPANKAKKNAAAAAVGAQNRDAHHNAKRGMRTDVADKIRGREVMQGQPRVRHEEVEFAEAAPAASGVADQMAAKKDALQSQIQRKIAQKQMDVMKAKANKRISSIKEGDGKKCSCGDTNESKMKCEMHGGKDKETKGGREAIVMNPPLKENAKQVDEKKAYEPDKLTKARNPLVYGDKKKSNPLVYRDKHRDNPLVYGKKKVTKEEAEQVDEVLDSPIKKMAYVMKAKKSIEKSDPKKIKQANDIANRVIGIKRVMNKLGKKD